MSIVLGWRTATAVGAICAFGMSEINLNSAINYLGIVSIERGSIVDKTITSNTYVGVVGNSVSLTYNLVCSSQPNKPPLSGKITVEISAEDQPIKKVIALGYLPLIGISAADYDISHVPNSNVNPISQEFSLDLTTLKHGVRDMCYTRSGVAGDALNVRVALGIIDDMRTKRSESKKPVAPEETDSFQIAAGAMAIPGALLTPYDPQARVSSGVQEMPLVP